MTAVIGATIDRERVVWSRRSGVFLFLLEDMSQLVEAGLRAKIVAAMESEAWDLDDLAEAELQELIVSLSRLKQRYEHRAASTGPTDPDYRYLIMAVDEIGEIAVKLVSSSNAGAL